uniref:Nuclear pore complex protein Nup153 n=1 Tax=Amphimedon queenslandica TaxID=400682 RepID=A0A1X7VGA6_AMPQE
MKSASQRSTKHHTSTPYDRPKPKGFVQTVKDWFTPSKWTKEVSSPLPNRTLPDHTPWPGTPHPIQGRQLDVRGVTHPLTPPSFDEFNEEPAEIKKNESPVLVSNKEERMEESSARSGSNTPLANTSVPLPYIAQNGLDPPPPTTCAPTTTYSHGSHYPHRGVRIKQRERDVPASSPYVSPSPGPLRTSDVGHATPKSAISSVPSRGHPSFSLSAFNTPVNTAALTNLSLSRSPFTSSFYTGRTSYGGASSSGRPSSSPLFRKRTRNETSPTSVQVGPVKRAVKPHPHTSQFPVGGASHTALKILDTLQSLSTPLQDARKLPLRATPAKKQRIEGPSATSPPPPVSSLSAPPTHAKLSKVRQPVVHAVASPPTPPPSRGKEKVVIDLTISPKEVKKTQAPPPTPPPSSSKSSTGKIRATKHTTHYSSKSRDGEGEEVYNTSELPPPIPLLLHKSGPLPSIDIPFLTPLTKEEPKVPTTTSNLTRSPFSSMTTASSYSFTSPEMALRSEPHPHATPISPINSSLFQFSDPLPVLVGSTSSGATRPPLTASGSLSFKAQPVSLPPPSSVPPAPPALSKPAGSLVDALKKPEYQIENIRKEAKQKSVMGPSTASLVGGETKGLSVPPLKPLKDVPLIVPTSNWSCDSCWVSNKSDTNKCMACGTSQPLGIKKKAVAFSTPSVTDAPSGGLKFPSGGSLTSTSGGLKLPTGGSLTSTSGGLKLPTGGSLIGTSGGSKLPTGNLTGEVKLPQGANVMLAPSGRIFSSSGPPSSASTSTNIASSSGSGFKLSSGGLSNVQLPTLVTPNTKSTVTPLSSLAPPTSNWECPVCMISNTKDSDTCVACGAKRSSGTSTDNKGSGTGFLKPGGKWECPTCMLHNDPSKDSCPACEAPRPGATAKTSQTSLNSSVKPVQFGDGGGMKLGGGLLLTGAAGGGLKLGGGGLNIFGGISSQSQSVSTNNTNTNQSVTLGVTTQSTTTSSSHKNVSVSSFISTNVTTGSSLLSSSSLSTASSLLPPIATKPSLFGHH